MNTTVLKFLFKSIVKCMFNRNFQRLYLDNPYSIFMFYDKPVSFVWNVQLTHLNTFKYSFKKMCCKSDLIKC